MAQVIEGNIFDVLDSYGTHTPISFYQQVNCQKKMGVGLAKQTVNRYPHIKNWYLNDLQRGAERMFGWASAVPLESGTKRYAVLLYSQFYYGRDKRYTNYARLGHALVRSSKYINHEGLVRLFPWGMGCGHGGGQWDIVQAIIEDVYPDAIFVRRPE